MAQQLPPPSKFSGNYFSGEETFEEWITHVKLVAEMHKWNSLAKLTHLFIITWLRGEAFTFFRSCSKQQKSSYDLMVKDRFTPVQDQSSQTSLYHNRKQRDNESADKYAQDCWSELFYKAYPQSQHGSETAKSMENRYYHLSS